jgi:hypothetical protein
MNVVEALKLALSSVVFMHVTVLAVMHVWS